MTLEQEPDPLRRIPTKHTSALRAEIGPILRAARLKRGQSLDFVAQQTRISKRFLEALEENKFEQFPAVVYLRGFLKGYCEHLDVNFDEIWTMLTVEPAAAEPSTPTSGGAETPAPTHAKPAVSIATSRPNTHAPSSHDSSAHVQNSGATGAIVLAVALTLGLCVFLFKDQGKKSETAAQLAPAALQPLPRSIEPKFLVRLKSDAWLRVSVDGQVVFEGRAPSGALQEWKPTKFVDLRTIEPSALELSLNGLPVALGAPGPDGQYRVEIP